MHALSAKNYRPDIDGLRALAVLSVIAFHAFPEWLAGGFIGVDIFFVISGFLIANLILSGLNQTDFRLSAFYASRVRRLFPALILVLLSCQAFGWFALLSDEYTRLGKHVSASGIFVANWVLWGESGYFDFAAESKPLLHLWSLGIEAQYYVFWPVLLCWMVKHKFNAIWLTAILLACSLGLNLALVEQFASATFFLPFTRMWELLAGSLLALFAQSNVTSIIRIRSQCNKYTLIKHGLPLLGMLLLFLGVFFIDRHQHFPGGLALLPVMGTLLIMAAGSQSWLNQRVLSNPMLVGVGLISYPLYLWHWPLLSFANILTQAQPSAHVRMACIAIALVLSVLTYYFLERPVRFEKNLRSKSHVLIALLLITASLGLITYGADGFKSRFSHQLIQAQTADLVFDLPSSQDWYCADASNEGPRCLSSGPNPSTVVMGDSHALTIYSGLVQRFKAKGQDIGLYGGSDGCPPLLDVVIQDLGGDTRNCLTKGSQAIRRVINDPAVKDVILTSRGPMYTTGAGFGEIESAQFGTWVLYFDGEKQGLRSNEEVFMKGLATTLDALLAAHKQVTFLHDVPELGFDIRSCFTFRPISLTQQVMKTCAVRKSDFLNRTHTHRAGVNRILSERPEVKVIDLAQALCDDEWCWGSKNDVLFYMDDDHLSHRGSAYVVKQLWDK